MKEETNAVRELKSSDKEVFTLMNEVLMEEMIFECRFQDTRR